MRGMDGARLIRDRGGGDRLTDHGGVGGELVAATVFELICRFSSDRCCLPESDQGIAKPRLVSIS